MKIRIFLSATRQGIEEARRGAIGAIEKADFEAESMELFGSRADSPLSTSMKEIDSCHILVAILSNRYGSSPPESDKSFSQIEFEHAMKIGRPVLAYLYRVDTPEPKQAQFIARVRTTLNVRPMIVDPDHLAECVVRDLKFLVSSTFINYITKADLPGRTPYGPLLFLPGAPTVPAVPLKEIQKLPEPDYAKFIGRTSEVRKIEGILSPVDRRYMVAINGIGGVGKSSLALETAIIARKKKDFERLIWVSAKKSRLTPEGMEEVRPIFSGLDDLLVHVALADRDRDLRLDSPANLYAAALDSLRRQRTLLVVDNLETVDDPSEISLFLAEVPSPSKVLVTTREEIPEGAVEIRLRELSLPETISFLQSETEPATLARLSEADYETIHDATGGIPLALKWVLGLLGRAGAKLENVLSTLSGRDSEPLKFCFSNVADRLSLESRRVVVGLAQFSPESTRELASELSGVTGLACDRAMQQLQQFSLFNRDDRTRTLYLLPLTRDFVEAQIAPSIVQDLAEYKRRAIDLCVAHGVMSPLAVLTDELTRAVGERERRPELARLEHQARNLQWAGKLKEAAQLAKGILENDPKNLIALKVRSRSLEELRENAEAAEAWTDLCNVEPENPHNWIHLSIVQRERGELSESLKAIQRAIALDPMNVIGNHCLAMLLIRMNNTDGARRQIERTLDLDADNKPTIQAWAILESNVGSKAFADKLFRRAFYKKPSSARERLHNAMVADAYARFLERIGNVDEARLQVEVGLTYDPDNRPLKSLKDRLGRRR